jgi:hypothetical protein
MKNSTACKQNKRSENQRTHCAYSNPQVSCIQPNNETIYGLVVKMECVKWQVMNNGGKDKLEVDEEEANLLEMTPSILSSTSTKNKWQEESSRLPLHELLSDIGIR